MTACTPQPVRPRLMAPCERQSMSKGGQFRTPKSQWWSLDCKKVRGPRSLAHIASGGLGWGLQNGVDLTDLVVQLNGDGDRAD